MFDYICLLILISHLLCARRDSILMKRINDLEASNRKWDN